MRIGLVVHDYGRTGGHSRYAVELARRFAADHEVHVFANTFGEPVPAGATSHVVPALRTTALTTVLSFAAARPARSPRLDLVHAQGYCGVRADVVTAHICAARWLETRRARDGRVPWKDRAFAAAVVPLERRTYTRPERTVIAVSSRVADDLRVCYGRRGDTVVIPHGVDRGQFNPERSAALRADARRTYGIASDARVLLFVGDARKGGTELVEAASQAAGATVLIVSRSDPRPLRALAAALGVGDRVILAGPTDAIECAYAAADLFVFPTPYDAFGMVITEAMACGLPVITTRQAGASELMRDGIDGVLLSDNRDIPEWGETIERLLGDPMRRQRMGRAAAESAARLTWDEVARRTLAIYEQTVARRRHRAA